MVKSTTLVFLLTASVLSSRKFDSTLSHISLLLFSLTLIYLSFTLRSAVDYRNDVLMAPYAESENNTISARGLDISALSAMLNDAVVVTSCQITFSALSTVAMLGKRIVLSLFLDIFFSFR